MPYLSFPPNPNPPEEVPVTVTIFPVFLYLINWFKATQSASWDTEYYNGIAIQFIVHVILGYADAAFQTSIVNPVDVLLYTISLTEGHPHVSNFGN